MRLQKRRKRKKRKERKRKKKEERNREDKVSFVSAPFPSPLHAVHLQVISGKWNKFQRVVCLMSKGKFLRRNEQIKLLKTSWKWAIGGRKKKYGGVKGRINTFIDVQCLFYLLPPTPTPPSPFWKEGVSSNQGVLQVHINHLIFFCAALVSS